MISDSDAPTPPDLSRLPLSEILCLLGEAAATCAPGEEYRFFACDPDMRPGAYAGEPVETPAGRLLYRSYRAWIDLAGVFGFRMLTPRAGEDGRVLLRFQRLRERGFHSAAPDPRRKYDPDSPFSRIMKNEEPAFLYHYRKALKRLDPARRRRILDLGLNRGDELEPLLELAKDSDRPPEIVGVDRAADALEAARRRFPHLLRTHVWDLNDLAALPLGRFDLILSIGTLQSPGIDTKPLIMRLVQEHLTADGALLLGWPNARWIDGELLYGARAPHYPFSELSLVIKDLFWIKKYLQQHRFRVVITGREYLFLEAHALKSRSV